MAEYKAVHAELVTSVQYTASKLTDMIVKLILYFCKHVCKNCFSYASCRQPHELKNPLFPVFLLDAKTHCRKYEFKGPK